MKKIWMFVIALTALGFLFFASSQAMASPADMSLAPKTRTPPGLANKTMMPPGQEKVHGKPVNFRGVISVVDAASLTISLEDGSSIVVGLTADTRIKIPTLGRNASVSDLQVGANVNVHAREGQDGSLIASMILVVPGKPALAHRVGTVTEYLPGVSITIEDSQGKPFTYLLTADTKILPDERADLLAVGSRVTIIAPRDVTSLDLTAQGIVVHP